MQDDHSARQAVTRPQQKNDLPLSWLACNFKCNNVDIRTQAHLHCSCAAACRLRPVQLQYSTARTWRKHVISQACTRLCLACGPIQMYGACTSSMAEIAGHALTDLSFCLIIVWVRKQYRKPVATGNTIILNSKEAFFKLSKIDFNRCFYTARKQRPFTRSFWGWKFLFLQLEMTPFPVVTGFLYHLPLPGHSTLSVATNSRGSTQKTSAILGWYWYCDTASVRLRYWAWSKCFTPPPLLPEKLDYGQAKRFLLELQGKETKKRDEWKTEGSRINELQQQSEHVNTFKKTFSNSFNAEPANAWLECSKMTILKMSSSVHCHSLLSIILQSSFSHTKINTFTFHQKKSSFGRLLLLLLLLLLHFLSFLSNITQQTESYDWTLSMKLTAAEI